MDLWHAHQLGAVLTQALFHQGQAGRSHSTWLEACSKYSRRLPTSGVVMRSNSLPRIEWRITSAPEDAGADAHQADAAARAQLLEHGQFLAEVVEINGHGPNTVFLASSSTG